MKWKILVLITWVACFLAMITVVVLSLIDVVKSGGCQ